MGEPPCAARRAGGISRGTCGLPCPGMGGSGCPFAVAWAWAALSEEAAGEEDGDDGELLREELPPPACAGGSR